MAGNTRQKSFIHHRHLGVNLAGHIKNSMMPRLSSKGWLRQMDKIYFFIRYVDERGDIIKNPTSGMDKKISSNFATLRGKNV